MRNIRPPSLSRANPSPPRNVYAVAKLRRTRSEESRAMSYPETDPGVPGMTGMETRRRSPYLRGTLVLGGIVAALAGGAVYWQRTHVPVYFDNGLPTWVTVRVDGAAFTVAAGGREKRELAPGTHPLTVTGPRGEIERYAAQIPAQSSVDDLFGSRFFVYNVAEA